MEAILNSWKTIRSKYIGFLENHTLEQLNRVPEGFSNNLIWNIGHIIVAQQGLIYKQSDLPMNVREELYEKYRSGTKPESDITEEERQELKLLLTSMIERTENDLANGVFKVYNERTTGTGFHLGNLNDALVFNNVHEGIHLGYMMAMRKSL